MDKYTRSKLICLLEAWESEREESFKENDYYYWGWGECLDKRIKELKEFLDE